MIWENPEIFEENVSFSAKTLFTIVKNKAYLSPGVKIRWKCNEKNINDVNIPTEHIFHFESNEVVRQAVLLTFLHPNKC